MAVPVTLSVYRGDQLIAKRDYERDFIKIGRLASAHLCLDDEKVSRIHSVIEVAADGSLSIVDMGSLEGTYVNGKRVNKGALAFGDEIRVGNTLIKVAAANLAEAAALGAGAIATSPLMGVDVAAALGNAASPAEALDPSVAVTERVAIAAPAPAPHRPKPQSSKKKASGPRGLLMRFFWGDQRVAEHFLAPGKKQAFSVGSAAGVDFVLGDGKLGASKLDIVTADAEGFTVHFSPKMRGELTRNQETYDFKHLIENGTAAKGRGHHSLLLEADDFGWVDLGGITLELSFQPVPKRILVPWGESLDFRMINIFLVMFFLGALFVITSMNRETEGEGYQDELSGSEARIAKLILKPPDVQKTNPLLEKLAQQKAEKESGEMAAKHRGDEGQMGKKDAPKRNAHAAPQGVPSQKDQGRMMVQRLFGGKGGISTVFGSGGLGGSLKSAMGNMFGTAAGDAQGFGGLGIKGVGSGGGGVGGTIGIGAIGTKGRGGGTGSYGNGVGVLGGKKGVDIGITSSDPEVQGSLDKDLIRAVIRRNINQIRYCYETQLTRFPKLSGKVAVRFVISGTGAVAQSAVAQSTVSNSELETCVAGRVRTWQFPGPKGGGVVVVTYPFLFKQSGD